MPAASAYPVLKAALVTRLSNRPNLADVVRVLDHVPVNSDELRTESGTYESIWMAAATGPIGPVVLCDGLLRFDEITDMTVVVQVLGVDSADTQTAVDERANELFYELLAEIAGQEGWNKADLGLDVFDYFWFEPLEHRWSAGRIQGQPAHGATVELDVQIRARRSFT